MKSEELNNLIQQMKDAPLPDCPRSLEGNVLRRVRLAKDEVKQSLVDWLFKLLPKPEFIVATFIITIGTSTGFTVVSSMSNVVTTQNHLVASRILDFDVLHENQYFNLNAD